MAQLCAGRLLFHELSHALYGNKRFAKVLDGAVRRMDEARGEEIAGRYREAGRTDAAELSEELAVHHAEDVLGNRENLARLLHDEPTIGDKILSFVGLAKTEYRGNERLSRAAGRLYRHFEAALAEFSAKHHANLAAETVTRVNSENVQVSAPAEGRRDAFKDSAPPEYNEKQYRAYGWARGNDVLTASENKDYCSKFAALKSGRAKFAKTARGEYMIPVSEVGDLTWEGVNRKLVYAKGTITNPVITRVLEIDLDNETEIGPQRREVYENERRGIQQETAGVFRRYDATDFPYQSYSGADKASSRHHNESGSDRGAGGGETGGVVGSSREVNQKRHALPDTAPDTTDAVGKERRRYKPSKADAFFTAKDRTYIETVDELHAVTKYFRKFGGMAKADAEARVQQARAARGQAQTMIGAAQYNVFSEKPERMGDGLLEIYKPTRAWSNDTSEKFEQKYAKNKRHRKPN